MTPRAKRWLLFLVGGGINTGLTYGIYLGLSRVLGYQQAYFIAYVLGIVFSYLFNARVVFEQPWSWRGLFAYPLVYLAQYLLSAAALGAMVEWLHVPKLYAPLIVTAIMVPMTYVMSKVVLQFSAKTRTLPGEQPMKEERPLDSHPPLPTPACHRAWYEAMGLTIPVLLTVLAIWLPFGFAMAALIEVWSVLGLFKVALPFFLAGIHSPMQAQALRPLTIFPQALA